MQNESWFKHVPETKCPTCGYNLNAVRDAHKFDTESPSEGDLALCAECYTPLLFNYDLTLRLLTREEHEDLKEEINEATVQLVIIKHLNIRR